MGISCGIHTCDGFPSMGDCISGLDMQHGTCMCGVVRILGAIIVRLHPSTYIATCTVHIDKVKQKEGGMGEVGFEPYIIGIRQLC